MFLGTGAVLHARKMKVESQVLSSSIAVCSFHSTVKQVT